LVYNIYNNVECDVNGYGEMRGKIKSTLNLKVREETKLKYYYIVAILALLSEVQRQTDVKRN
jgi:hypothetical protein